MTGIYELLCTANGKRLIAGSSRLKNVFDWHLARLHYGEHPNPMMQADHDLYGRDAFDFRILMQCDRIELLYLEAAFLAAADPAMLYNPKGEDGLPIGEAHTVGRTKLYGQPKSEATREKLRQLNKRPRPGTTKQMKRLWSDPQSVRNMWKP